MNPIHEILTQQAIEPTRKVQTDTGEHTAFEVLEAAVLRALEQIVEVKMYTYYVGTFNLWVLIEADNAREALEQGENHPELKTSEDKAVILTVRVATQKERSDVAWHKKQLEGES